MTTVDPESSTTEISTLQRKRQLEHTGMESPISESQEPEQHQFVKSIGDLTALSAAINAFKSKYDDLQSHIEFIENAIDARLTGVNVEGGVGASSSSVIQSPMEIDAPANKPPQVSATAEPESSEMPEVQLLCESMSSKGLRKYILNNIAEPAKLMEDIPEALKLAKDPSKLVFESIGKFYLQGRRAYTKDSPMIPSRKASLLVMECFLLMVDPDDANTMVENSTKVVAEKAAFAWRNRLISEGGFANAQPMDARGLLLLIACFGIPSNFEDLHLLDLLRQSKAFEISSALRRSTFIVPRIPGVIELGIKRKMHVDAVDLVYTFGLEDKFSPPSILISFLRINKDAFEKAKQMAHSPLTLKAAKEKQLTALLSVFRCLEAHNLDPMKVLGGWQIKDQIVNLEKDIVELNKEIEEKERSFRMMEEAVLAQRLYNRETKRGRLSGMEMPMPASSYSPIYHDRSFPTRGDGDNISALVSSYLGSQSFVAHKSSSSLLSSRETVDGRGAGRGVSAFEPHTGNMLSNVYSPPMHSHSLSRQFSPAHRKSVSPRFSPIAEPSLSGQHIPLGLERVLRHSPSVDHVTGLPRHSSLGDSPSD